MSNPWYTNTRELLPGAQASGKSIDDDFDGIEAAFDSVYTLILSALKFSNADLSGTNMEITEAAASRAGKFPNFDSNGALQFTEVEESPTTSIVEYAIKTEAYTAVHRDRIACDTSGGAFTVTLPASPTAGNFVIIKVGDVSTYNLTIARNGSNINSTADDLVVDMPYAELIMVYYDATIGWGI